MRSDFTEKMDAFMASYEKEKHYSGVLYITEGEKSVYRRYSGFADWETKREFTPDSVFRFYSISKAFTALAVVKEVERGNLDLDLHPGEYLPEARGFHPKCTLRNMLHHVSGAPDAAQTKEFFRLHKGERYGDIRAHLASLASCEGFFAPGEDVNYSNIGFNVAYLILKEMAGGDYEGYMKREVFEPLGAKTALIDGPKLSCPELVTGYGITKEGVIAPDPAGGYWMEGAGDVLGTAADVYTLHRAVKEKSFFQDPESWEKYIFAKPPVGTYSLGCRRAPWHGRTRIVHNGGSAGFRTYHIHMPEENDLDIILLSNNGWGDSRVEITEKIYEYWFGETSVKAERIELDKGYAK